GIWIAGNLKAQKTQKIEDVSDIGEQAIIPTYNLAITWNKTTTLIFPSQIQSADRGDAAILAERVKGSENVLKVKAGSKNFEPSSLTVITTDGQVYAFNVKYTDDPPYLVLDVRRQPPYAPVDFNGVSLNSKELEGFAGKVNGMLSFIHGVHENKNGIDFTLEGIYIRNDVLFFRYRLHNLSSIPFNASSLRFYVRDKKKARRSAVQDNETKPLFRKDWGKPEDILGQSIVVAFPKFTIAESKDFVSELMEEHGDRNATLKLNQRKLLKAKPLLQ
ncbi:MAG TPA: conjugative transposon protein TraN, partial [Dongiaceae bacterium]|nr:conjugative transposon protein TraN [Dongiaceae bacterium]